MKKEVPDHVAKVQGLVMKRMLEPVTEPETEVANLLHFVLEDSLAACTHGVHTAFRHKPSKAKDGLARRDLVQGFFRADTSKLEAIMRLSGKVRVIRLQSVWDLLPQDREGTSS